MKEKVLKLLDDLYDEVQSLRENGETDLRTVLHQISSIANEIDKLKD